MEKCCITDDWVQDVDNALTGSVKFTDRQYRYQAFFREHPFSAMFARISK